MPSIDPSGFKGFRGGSPLWTTSWDYPNTIPCGGGDSDFVGAIRLDLPEAASSISVTGRGYNSGIFYAGTLKADIRTSELSRPLPTNISADDTARISSTTGTVTFTFNGSWSAGYVYIYITHNDDTAYVDLLTSSISASYTAGSTAEEYEFRAIDTNGTYLNSTRTSESPIRESYVTGVPSDYEYVGYQRGSSISNARSRYLSSGTYSTSSTAYPSSTYPAIVFVYEEPVTTFYYRCYDLTNGQYITSSTPTTASSVTRPSQSGYTYQGYVYHTSYEDALNQGMGGNYDGTGITCDTNSSYPYIIFFYTASYTSWQTPTSMATISGSSYTSYSTTTTVDCYRAGYVRYYTPSYAGKLVFQTTSQATDPDYYSYLSTSTLSAGSGTSRSAAVRGSTLVTDDDGGPSGYDTMITYEASASTYYYWYVNAEFAGTGTYSIPWRLNYYRRYSVTYNANNGSGAPSTQYFYSDNTSITISSTTPTRSGYNFLGWSTSSTASSATYTAGSTYSLSAQNYTLYAVWQQITYTYHYRCYNISTSSYVTNDTTTTSTSTSTSIASPSQSGLTYLGYTRSSSYTNALNLYQTSGFTGTGTTATATTTYSYIIFFYQTTYTSWQTPTQMVAIDGEISYEATSTINCYAAGYVNYTSPSYAGKIVFQTTSGSISPDYYSYLSLSTLSAASGSSRSASVTGYTTSDDNGGTSGNDTLISYNCAADTSYYWYVNAEFASSGTYSVPWRLDYYRRYSITYNANNGSGAPGVQYFYADNTTVTLSTTTPTRAHYTFLGWSTDSNADSASYSSGNSYSFSGDTTLYAVWKINTVTLTYDANGGSGAPFAQTTDIGTNWTIDTTANVIKDGFNFKGWATTDSAMTPTYKKGVSATLTASVDTTLYAVWWPIFNWDTETANQANILVQYIATYIGQTLSTVVSNGIYLANWYNSLADVLGVNQVNIGDIITDEQMQNLADGYNNY